ncbi:malate:quinone oxidoreductase [Olivibacter sitiensis]|uniref:malate:quinone oxidoreductase n=1 Tax=Olivibacter sitiensis TaxID=376470 RepID=UPI0003F7D875|nr:malate:quinone oxidoreductase [Olivibacter sitiensis]
MSNISNTQETDVLLIGAGIMSATLGVMLKKIMPDAQVQVYERLNEIAAESSDAWNNAGTGHSALCELNYTPELPDGSVEIKKAIHIAEQFEVSKEFWSYLVEDGVITDPKDFIRMVPHMSFVWGEKNVEYLRKRYEKMAGHHFFKGMEYSEDHGQLRKWIPLIMEGRDASEHLAATKIDIGTDVNFGALTRMLFSYLQQQPNVNIAMRKEVRRLHKLPDGRWSVTIKDMETKERTHIITRFIFIGAGGGALRLLEKSGIPEGRGFGGFPVGGQWLRCTNEEIIAEHAAKVYGKASVGAPPMSVPHLDTRVIDGKKALLFGPFAGFSTKFLKQGSWLDLPFSIKMNNIKPMVMAGLANLSLTKYLIEQVRLSQADRVQSLRDFVPTAKDEDWELEVAGQRVQVIKKDPEKGGILQFGTEVVTSADGSISALLGASPGASTSVSIMLTLIQRCFKDKVQSKQWQDAFKKMIPSYGESLAANAALAKETRDKSSKSLQLEVKEEVEG